MSTPAPWAADALWAGELIVARLRSELPELREVTTIDGYDPKVTEPKQLPAAVVVAAGMQPVGNTAQRVQAAVVQQWLVVLGVRSAARPAGRNAGELGPLISRAVRALQGWTPGPDDRFNGQRALVWSPGGPRPSYGNNVSYWPLLFHLQVVTA